MEGIFTPNPRLGYSVLRLGLGAVILWFGLNETLDPASWLTWVPAWTSVLGLSPLTIVYLNGAFETAAACLLLLGVYVRMASALLFLHMLLIVFDIGPTAIGIRDFGLAAALFALAAGPAE
jgi:uncharacterized membrane protein YphA (DoxX/SURF4 family)